MELFFKKAIYENCGILQPRDGGKRMLNSKIDLSGIWKFEMAAKECAHRLDETVKLPGSMDENQKGEDNSSNISRTYLNRDYIYSGKATYQKEIKIPFEWAGKDIELFLERTRKTRVWIDGNQIGSGQQKSYVTPHRYDLTSYVEAGNTYILTIEVDNSPQNLPEAMYTTFEKEFPWGHMVSEHTQTNWNGILGELSLRAVSTVRIESFKIRPDLDKNVARVFMKIARNSYKDAVMGSVELQAESYNNNTDSHIQGVQSFQFSIAEEERSIELVMEYQMGNNVLLWDEFHPTLYKMNAVVRSTMGGKFYTSTEKESFGMRKFEALYVEEGGKQFAVNGRPTQLRGEINCAVFPMTGYAPMDLSSWMRVMKIYKEYGMNHVRFHTWVPPKAAFQAADLLGMYIQFELPQWGHKMFGDIDKGDTTDADYYWDETIKIFDNYLNSPSAVMMALGNELRPGFYYYDVFLARCKEQEPDILYTDIAGWSAYSKNVDFSGSVPTKGEDYLHRIEPATNWDHWDNTSKSPVPFLAHEVGQLQVYPDYEKDIHKYYDKNSLMKPRNLEVFKKILTDSEIGEMSERFNRSTAELSLVLYKYMIESYLRTPGAGGFQLLGLQDFPGQGTALIGILDPFLEEKINVSSEKFRQSCSELTILAKVSKFTWNNNEIFTADIVIANYSAADISTTVSWNITTQNGIEVTKGIFKRQEAVQGQVTDIGTIQVSLDRIKEAEKLILHLHMDERNKKIAPYAVGTNEYSLWVYPSENKNEQKNKLSVYTQFSENAEEELKSGKNVLIISGGTKEFLPKSRAMTFRPDFWSPMFHSADHDGYVLGCFIHAKHPIFAEFPTDTFADWQWYDLIDHSRSILLEGVPRSLNPIVQAIPSIDLGERLGVLFEAKVGKGKLVVSSIDLLNNQSLSAKQLLHSIQNYMYSEAFEPETELKPEVLREILPEKEIQRTVSSRDILKTKEEKVPADKTEFFKVLSAAGTQKKVDYTLESWENFEKVYKQAKSFGALTNAVQQEVDSMTKQLQEAMDALINHFDIGLE